MELANIEQLLQKYLNAETTLEEEKIVKNYFLSKNVAPHLEEYKYLFEYFALSKNDRYTKSIQLKTKKRNWKWLSVAASLLIVVSVYVGYQKNQQQKAEKAFIDTQFALKMLSTNLNKGTVAIGHLQEFEKTKNKIFKQPKK